MADREKSLYVGDAAGRKGDHSNTDFTMALNAGLNFETPEVRHTSRAAGAYPAGALSWHGTQIPQPARSLSPNRHEGLW